MNHPSITIDHDVALVTMDDGKANALSHKSIAGLHAALERAESEARATVLAGRSGLFSAGFDLGPMTAGAESATALLRAGTELMLRMVLHPQPLVVACTGHALAGGALLLLCADTRIGARGRFKIGLNEVAIGLRLPILAVELARERLGTRHLLGATVEARQLDPESACAVGFLDRVVDAEAVIQTAVDEASSLAQLNGKALAETKRVLRGAMVEHVRATLDDDLANIDVSQLKPRG